LAAHRPLPPLPTRRSPDLPRANASGHRTRPDGIRLAASLRLWFASDPLHPRPLAGGGQKLAAPAAPTRHAEPDIVLPETRKRRRDRKSTRLNSSHVKISYA